MRLSGRVAIVTGASRGIGRAVARTFAREKAAVILAARSGPELEAVARQIEDAGGRAITVAGDVSNETGVNALVERALSQHGRIDVLVTAAGTAHFGLAAETKLTDWDEVLSVNLRGAMLCCRSVLPAMMAQRSGTIINIGSVVTSRVLTGCAAYTASKYGLLGFSRVLAEEMRAHGVRVAVLSAGATDTALWDAIPNPPDRKLMLRPEQVADAALAMVLMEPNATLEEMTLLPAGGVL